MLKPKYDPMFKPAYIEIVHFLKEAKKQMKIALKKDKDSIYCYDFATSDNIEESTFYLERFLKSLLWIVGGHSFYLAGDKKVIDNIKNIFSKKGKRAFDVEFMEKIYEHKFEIIESTINNFPLEKKNNFEIGGKTKGGRIGFDAGGSDRKVSAVLDGKVLYSEEVVWSPKIQSNWKYHYNEILSAFKKAAEKLPKVDAIGVSSAGIYINNYVRVASLFLKIPEDDFEKHIKTLYIDLAKEMGNVPLIVANDGDVTALAGAISLNDNGILGIAMGTSEAAGYINTNGGINGWLNELAFVPIDYNQSAMEDEWSQDIGCGVKYFSQDGAIKLAQNAGINLEGTPGEKLKALQKLADEGDERVSQIFIDIGIYLGHTLAFYAMFYEIKHVLILGRVTSGIGGEMILKYTKKVIIDLYPHLLEINISLPDEKSRRVGQSVAAASL